MQNDKYRIAGGHIIGGEPADLHLWFLDGTEEIVGKIDYVTLDNNVLHLWLLNSNSLHSDDLLVSYPLCNVRKYRFDQKEIQ